MVVCAPFEHAHGGGELARAHVLRQLGCHLGGHTGGGGFEFGLLRSLFSDQLPDGLIIVDDDIAGQGYLTSPRIRSTRTVKCATMGDAPK